MYLTYLNISKNYNIILLTCNADSLGQFLYVESSLNHEFSNLDVYKK